MEEKEIGKIDTHAYTANVQNQMVKTDHAPCDAEERKKTV